MPFAAGFSTHADLARAVAEAAAPVQRRFEQQPADLTFVFVSHAHQRQFERLPELLHRTLTTQVLLGCTAEAVIAAEHELERGPAVAVWSARLPGAELVPFQLQFERTPDGIVSTGMPEWVDGDPLQVRAVLMLGEPFSSAPHSFLDRLHEELPGVPVLGGMASGAAAPGENRLFLQGDALTEGAVGVALRGGPAVRSLVSQGCRPIGSTYVITRAEQNVVIQLGGKPALERLQEVYESLSPHDREQLEQGVHLGLAMNEYQEEFGPGDFLIANVLGARRDIGAIAVASLVRVGQTVQFHMRDAASADDDLRTLLNRPMRRPAAGLLFSCNGRGTRLFAGPHHDAAAVQAALGPLPLAGFFANGELGPIGGRNFIHGYTASLALFDDE